MVNRVLVHALCIHFGHSKQRDNYLQILQHSYNKATHSSTGFSPFEVFVGFQPTSPASPPLTLAPQGTLHQQQEQLLAQRFLQQIQQCHNAVTEAIKETQDRAKERYMTNREQPYPIRLETKYGYTWTRKGSKANIVNFVASNVTLTQFRKKWEKILIDWTFPHSWAYIM